MTEAYSTNSDGLASGVLTALGGRTSCYSAHTRIHTHTDAHTHTHTDAQTHLAVEGPLAA